MWYFGDWCLWKSCSLSAQTAKTICWEFLFNLQDETYLFKKKNVHKVLGYTSNFLSIQFIRQSKSTKGFCQHLSNETGDSQLETKLGDSLRNAIELEHIFILKLIIWFQNKDIKKDNIKHHILYYLSSLCYQIMSCFLSYATWMNWA